MGTIVLYSNIFPMYNQYRFGIIVSYFYCSVLLAMVCASILSMCIDILGVMLVCERLIIYFSVFRSTLQELPELTNS